MTTHPNYIIFSPSYDENIGGSIVLHKLCHTLNEMGQTARIWPPRLKYRPNLKDRISNFLRPDRFSVCSEFNTPIASRKDVNDFSIIVYPEVVAGNPLEQNNVVRWFLHKPGFHTGVVDYGENELYFVFDDYSIGDRFINDNIEKLFLFTRNPCYRNLRYKERTGSCYLIRKGDERRIVHDLTDSVKIDDLPHSEVSEIFNKTEAFYSYDETTMYSQFAALCGCISIVIPTHFKNREEWVKSHPISKYGIAYGLEDIDHAIATRGLLHEYLGELERSALESVKQFIEDTYEFFNFEGPFECDYGPVIMTSVGEGNVDGVAK